MHDVWATVCVEKRKYTQFLSFDVSLLYLKRFKKFLIAYRTKKETIVLIYIANSILLATIGIVLLSVYITVHFSEQCWCRFNVSDV